VVLAAARAPAPIDHNAAPQWQNKEKCGEHAAAAAAAVGGRVGHNLVSFEPQSGFDTGAYFSTRRDCTTYSNYPPYLASYSRAKTVFVDSIGWNWATYSGRNWSKIVDPDRIITYGPGEKKNEHHPRIHYVS